MFDLIEKITTALNRELGPDELREGDIISLTQSDAIITEIDDDQISVALEDGGETSVERAPQYVARRIPDSLEYWIFLSLSRGDPITCYALEKQCWKCKQYGYAIALETGNCLVTDGPSVFRYGGVRRQLREFFAGRPDVRKRFGRVTKRFSKSDGSSGLSQGCPDCDVIWGAFHLRELLENSLVNADESLKSGKMIIAFDLEVERLFEEGHVPERTTEGESRSNAHHQ